MWEVKLADQCYRSFKERVCKKNGTPISPIENEAALVYQFGISMITFNNHLLRALGSYFL